jgi:hypothetical protein
MEGRSSDRREYFNLLQLLGEEDKRKEQIALSVKTE